MEYDPRIARRMIRNGARRTANSWGDVRDLGEALAITSQAPIDALNCLSGFTTNDREVEALLDIGFALLRAFDRDPATELTPLDRPKSLAERLRRRRMRVSESRSWMVFEGDAAAIVANPAVEVRIAEPDDIRDYARIHGGSASWARKLSYRSTVNEMLDRRNTFYLGCIDGEPVATLHLLVDAKTAGIYGVSTLRAHRRKGVSTTLLRRAILDAQEKRCDVVCLSTDAGGYAQTLYERLGFSVMFESQLWTATAR